MKKNKKILFFPAILVILLAIIGYAAYQASREKEVENKLSDEEMEFNQSGRAKAIEDETDLWNYYEDAVAGFSIKYPHNVSFDEAGDSLFHLSIESQAVDLLEGTMGFDKETALKNVESLKQSEFGESVDWPLEESRKVRKISDENAQEFMVLSRFEVCDVVFERKLYFFQNNHQVIITLTGPRDEIINSVPEYFELNPENCGAEKIWNFENQKLFFQKLESNTASAIAQNWFNLFDKIVATIILEQANLSNFDLLQGKWISTDDTNSMIEFKDNSKIDYYSDEQLSEESFNLYQDWPVAENSQVNKNGEYLIVGSSEAPFEYAIADLSDEVLVLIYLPRGNTLEYERVRELRSD